MKTINKSLEELLKSGILDSLSNYESSNDGNFLSDIYLHYNPDNQTLSFFDDIEKELICINLSEKDIHFQGDFIKELKHSAKKVLKELENDKVFNREFIYKPFTVNLVDEDFIILDELIFIDDDTVQLDNEIWNNLDKELDSFFNDLMK